MRLKQKDTLQSAGLESLAFNRSSCENLQLRPEGTALPRGLSTLSSSPCQPQALHRPCGGWQLKPRPHPMPLLEVLLSTTQNTESISHAEVRSEYSSEAVFYHSAPERVVDATSPTSAQRIAGRSTLTEFNQHLYIHIYAIQCIPPDKTSTGVITLRLRRLSWMMPFLMNISISGRWPWNVGPNTSTRKVKPKDRLLARNVLNR